MVETFITVALEGGPDPTDKYQYPEWSKLHQVVSLLVRCCDVSSKCQNSHRQAILPNPYAENSEYIMPLPPNAMELLYAKTAYIKKLLEDPNPSEESIKLIHFCSWENLLFSREVLSECLWQISFHCQDMKHHFDLLLHLLLMEDSWQTHRCTIALQGSSGGLERPDQKKGLLDILIRSKNDYPKRTYQCIRCLTALFSQCRVAHNMLNDPEAKEKWKRGTEWLREELERVNF